MKNGKKSGILSMLLSVPILALSVFFWASITPNAGAFSGPVTQCVGCHTFFNTAPAPHAPHPALGCTQCHAAIGDIPLSSKCGVCHSAAAIAPIHPTAQGCVTCHGAPTPETNCTDGIDNDGNGLMDCNDPNCQNDPACAANPEICNDGIDNNDNGLTDCADPACATNPACVAPKETDCSDGIDNDGDGKIDCADSDCASTPACTTSGPPSDHTDVVKGIAHKPGKADPTKTGCTACHGADLKGGAVNVSCYTCHGRVWAQNGLVPVSHTVKRSHTMHKPGLKYPFQYKCTDCHGADLRGSSFASSCYKCHGSKWKDKDKKDKDDKDKGGKGGGKH